MRTIVWNLVGQNNAFNVKRFTKVFMLNFYFEFLLCSIKFFGKINSNGLQFKIFYYRRSREWNLLCEKSIKHFKVKNVT